MDIVNSGTRCESTPITQNISSGNNNNNEKGFQDIAESSTHTQENVTACKNITCQSVVKCVDDQSGSTPYSTTHSTQSSPKKSFAFYSIIVALAFTGLLTSLEATITSTALPTIINVLGGADLYVWVVNIYFLTM
jgi:hypothetical protein